MSPALAVPEPARRPFARQLEAGPFQRAFDLLAGVGLPLLCVLVDPYVFRGLGSPLSPYRTQFRALIGIEVLALLAWLALGPRLGRRAAWLAGVMRVGSFLSGLLALLLLPLAAFMTFGLIMMALKSPVDFEWWTLFVLLGFAPALTVFVYERNARRARRAPGYASGRRAFRIAFWGTLLAFVASLLLATAIAGTGLRDVRSQDPATAARGVDRLRRWSWYVYSPSVLLRAFRATHDRREQKAYNDAFRELTGYVIGDSTF
jgi:hypothetical protein